MLYTYFHTHKDDGKIFYVGSGSPRRPWAVGRKNKLWHQAARRSGYDVHIASPWVSLEEAHLHEKLLISCLMELGQPPVNRALGGFSNSGSKASPESNSTRSKSLLGKKHGAERRAHMSMAWSGRQRYSCSVCSLVTFGGQMTQHQLASGHSGRVKV